MRRPPLCSALRAGHSVPICSRTRAMRLPSLGRFPIGLGPAATSVLTPAADGDAGNSSTYVHWKRFGSEPAAFWAAGSWVVIISSLCRSFSESKARVTGRASGSLRRIVPLGSATSDQAFDVKTDWFASITGRVGYDWNRWLLYIKGGAAWARFESRVDIVNCIVLSGSGRVCYRPKQQCRTNARGMDDWSRT